MEVHAPEGGIHSWRDFLIHMGTICLGLLIALGLEQAVVSLHEAHQRAELREALDTDSRQEIRDAERSERATDALIAWTLARIAQVRAVSAAKGSIPPPTVPPKLDFDTVTDPQFQAAKSAGLLALLSQQEIIAYSEADLVTADLSASYEQWKQARRDLQQFAFRFRSTNGTPDYSSATPEEQRRYLDLLIAVLSGEINFRFYNKMDRGLQIALLRGERDLKVLQQAERSLTTPAPGAGLNRM